MLNYQNKQFLIILDDRNQFYSSTRESGASMNIELIKEKLENLGHTVLIKGFSEIDFVKENYKDLVVIYQSTEDPDLRYKDYIEDILIGLKLSDANLIPPFECFRAHHNKVFMEILRKKMNYGECLDFFHFGTLEELTKSKQKFPYPVIIKPGAGSKGKDIFLVHNRKELLRRAAKISSSYTTMNIARILKYIFLNKKYKAISNHRRKFIIQEFIPKLSGDYKVLAYGDKYYVVRRENRPGDFRASGSGLLSFPEKIPDGLLDYAQDIFEKSNTPFMGMDIADSNGKLYLIEFQFIAMGNYALEKSSFYFKKKQNEWELIRAKSILEDVFVESIDRFTNNKN